MSKSRRRYSHSHKTQPQAKRLKEIRIAAKNRLETPIVNSPSAVKGQEVALANLGIAEKAASAIAVGPIDTVEAEAAWLVNLSEKDEKANSQNGTKLEAAVAGEDEGLWDLVEARMAFMEENVWLNTDELPYNVWGLVEERIDPNRWRPRHRPDYEVVAEIPKPGSENKEVIYYLKCRSAHAFLKIGARQLFVWNLMDGDHTLRDIMFAYREEYKTMPIFQINQAVNIFKSCRMLDEPEQTVFDRLGQLFEDGAKKLHLNPLYLLTKAKINVDNIDPRVDKLYRYGGWLIYKPFILLPLLLISFIGVGLALYTLFSGQPLANEIGKVGGGMYALFTYLTLLPLFFIHETSHALTVKHYKREVMGGGFMLLRGMPSMFMDTSDIWMDRNKWHRVMVSVAGPLSNICVAGILTLIALQLPVGVYSAFLFALAINNIVNAVLNMCPLIELDGYFALMDMMGESGLRAKALKFIRKEFPKRWQQIGKFNRKEWLYLIFGLLALLYTFAITSCMVMFAIRIVIINPIAGMVVGILAILYLSYRLWYKAKAARKWRKQNEKSEEWVAKAATQVKKPAALNSPAVMVIPNPSDKRG